MFYRPRTGWQGGSQSDTAPRAEQGLAEGMTAELSSPGGSAPALRKSLPFWSHFLQLAACSLHILRATSLPCINIPFPRTQLALAVSFSWLGVGSGDKRNKIQRRHGSERPKPADRGRQRADRSPPLSDAVHAPSCPSPTEVGLVAPSGPNLQILSPFTFINVTFKSPLAQLNHNYVSKGLWHRSKSSWHLSW